jgi:hypothetical protein
MKDGNTFYMQLSRKIFTPEYEWISNNGRLLYMVLNELEQRYTNGDKDFFFRSNEDLAKDCRFSLPTLKRAKAELVKSGLIQTWQSHYREIETGKLSKKHITCYRILG